MAQFWKETAYILGESAPYLLAGFLIAGLLNALLGRYPRITSVLIGRGSRPIFLAALLGAPLPLCSCSVIPSALMLRRQGASKGTVASFLISVPETDVVSITLTYALLGPVMAVARPVAAIFSAVLAGLSVNRWAGAEQSRSPLAAQANVPIDDPRNGEDCDCGPETGRTKPRSRTNMGWLRQALHFGFVEMFDDIIVQILAGIVIAGAVVAWLPGLDIAATWGHSPAAYLVMLLLGIPVYVCASASTPLALGLIAGGISPGAALVFLLTGPATNMASLVVLAKQLGVRALVFYLASVALGAVTCGVLLDLVFAPGNFSVSASASPAPGPEWEGGAGSIGAAILLALAAWSLYRTRRLPRWYAAIRSRFAGAIHR